jgi:hypothetical protein
MKTISYKALNTYYVCIVMYMYCMIQKLLVIVVSLSRCLVVLCFIVTNKSK